MADPLSISASVLGVAGAGLAVASSIVKLVDTWKGAPQELIFLGRQIKNNATLLSSVLRSLKKHESLFKDEFEVMLRDLGWRFKLIQKIAKKLTKGSDDAEGKRGILRRISWMVQHHRLKDLKEKLEALKLWLQLIVSVINLAESQR